MSKPRLLLVTFMFSGALGGVSGALFATLQSYITPDAFTFDLSVRRREHPVSPSDWSHAYLGAGAMA